MKPKKNIFSLSIFLLINLLHQSCIEDLDLLTNENSGIYVIDAMLNSSDSIHFVQISFANEAPIDTLTKFSVRLTDDKGGAIEFQDTEEILANYPPLIDYYGYYNHEYEDELDSIFGKCRLFDENSYWRNPKEIIIQNSVSKTSKIFFSSDCNLEVGRKYTLTVTIDDKEYSATEKLLPPIKVKSVRYKQTKEFKSIETGYLTFRIPVFSLINQSKESKYFIASISTLNSLYRSSIRLFSTENMGDTIKELQFSRYSYEPTYQGGSGVYYGSADDWYEHIEDIHERCYCFYPISKTNYDYYKVIEKQIKTDGGLYSPNAATPVTNFTGGKVYGQFIVTSESYIYNRGGYNY